MSIETEIRQIIREELNEIKEEISEKYFIDSSINTGRHHELLEAISKLCPDNTATMKDLMEMQKEAEQDDYHTMEELYDHRIILFALVCAKFPEMAWKSEKHSDGTSENGWFIAGLETPYGQITYHQKMTYWNVFQCKELDKAPEYDGHSPDHVLTRLSLLIRDISKL